MTKALGYLSFALLGAVVATAITWTLAAPKTAPTDPTPPKTLYTCGMHPEVIRPGPGSCPICKMDLTPIHDGPATRAHDHPPCTDDRALYWQDPADSTFISDRPGTSPAGEVLIAVCDRRRSGTVTIDPTIRQAMGVRTARVERGPLRRSVRTVARVVPDERKQVVVTTKFEGWIERMYVNETGQFVRAGQRLCTVYSPSLVASQQEYLLAVRQNNPVLIRTAEDRLRLWDLTSAQIEALKARGTPEKAVALFAPTSGYVVQKDAVEGSRVRPDRPLFRIVDLNTVWVQADVYEYEVPWIEVGQSVALELSYVTGRTFEGKVSYIYPYVDESSRTVQVRLEFKNPDLVLRPGMFGTVRIETQTRPNVLRIASEAIIRTGQRDLVFVDLGRGAFRAVKVKLGDRGDDGLTEVLHGLHEGQRIVTSGQFLLDSESQLREAIAKMVPPSAGASSQPASRPASRPASMPSSRPASQPSSRPASMPSSMPASRPAEPSP